MKRLRSALGSIGTALVAAGCLQPSPRDLKVDGMAGRLGPGDQEGIAIVWVWDRRTDRELYGVALFGGRRSLQLAAAGDGEKPGVRVAGIPVPPPPEDGFLYVFDAHREWQRSPVTVAQLREWKKSNQGPQESALWRETLIPFLKKSQE